MAILISNQPNSRGLQIKYFGTLDCAWLCGSTEPRPGLHRTGELTLPANFVLLEETPCQEQLESALPDTVLESRRYCSKAHGYQQRSFPFSAGRSPPWTRRDMGGEIIGLARLLLDFQPLHSPQ